MKRPMHGNLAEDMPKCIWCRSPYEPKRADARSCSEECEKNYRNFRDKMARRREMKIMKEMATDVFGKSWDNLTRFQKHDIRSLMREVKMRRKK